MRLLCIVHLSTNNLDRRLYNARKDVRCLGTGETRGLRRGSRGSGSRRSRAARLLTRDVRDGHDGSKQGGNREDKSGGTHSGQVYGSFEVESRKGDCKSSGAKAVAIVSVGEEEEWDAT